MSHSFTVRMAKATTMPTRKAMSRRAIWRCWRSTVSCSALDMEDRGSKGVLTSELHAHPAAGMGGYEGEQGVDEQAQGGIGDGRREGDVHEQGPPVGGIVQRRQEEAID